MKCVTDEKRVTDTFYRHVTRVYEYLVASRRRCVKSTSPHGVPRFAVHPCVRVHLLDQSAQRDERVSPRLRLRLAPLRFALHGLVRLRPSLHRAEEGNAVSRRAGYRRVCRCGDASSRVRRTAFVGSSVRRFCRVVVSRARRCSFHERSIDLFENVKEGERRVASESNDGRRDAPPRRRRRRRSSAGRRFSSPADPRR